MQKEIDPREVVAVLLVTGIFALMFGLWMLGAIVGS